MDQGNILGNRIEEILSRCDRVCDYLDPERGTIRFTHTLRQSFRYEMLKYALFLADADGCIETKEVLAIQKYLHSPANLNDLKMMRTRERIPFGFKSATPGPLRMAVMHDSKAEDSAEPFGNQCAQIMLDAYKALGRIFLALHGNDPTDQSAKVYTDYMDTLTNYLKDFGVLYPVSQKLFRIEELEELEEKKPDKEHVIEEAYEAKLQEQQGENNEEERSTAAHKKTPEEDDTTLEEKLEEFHDMIGLGSVKREVDALINLLRVQKLRAENGLKNTETSKHMVFYGNPGTGKTTVARILAGIYKDLGVLKNGNLVEVDRSGLVKGYVGQTAIQVKKVVEEALGGILFIDEAYTLTVGKGENDYGQEAVDTLLKAMEDYREELIVIVAGYPDLMDQFLESNPGLKSRFNKFIHFEDYSPKEQYEILGAMCAKQEYVLSQDAKEYMQAYLEERMKHEIHDFANARDVRNMLENAIMKQASRVIETASPTKEVLQTLIAEDFMESL